jgi:hypothetical protein
MQRENAGRSIALKKVEAVTLPPTKKNARK